MVNVKFNRFVVKYSHFFIYLLVFLAVFINGRRVNTTMSLIYATIDTVFFAALYQTFCRLLIKTPRTLQNKVLRFVVILIILIFSCHLLFGIEYLIHLYAPVTRRPRYSSDYQPFINLAHFLKVFIINLFALCIAIYKYSNFVMTQTDELKKEQKLMKLQLLQSQINPHFLFNALNNIYVLVYTKNDIASDALMKLSDMLRYVTDFGLQEKVPIERELTYMQNYVDFQILRFGSSERIDYRSQLDSMGYSIAPLLIQPFVENCFTHSDLATNPEGFVRIQLEIKDGLLQFVAENSVSQTHVSHEGPKENSIGIDNVEQRLKLYYPDDYIMKMKEENNVYKVELSLKLR